MNGDRDMTVGLGPYIRRLREQRGWTQAELEGRTGINRARIAQIEGGMVKLPGVRFRRRLAAALDVSALDLLIAAGEISPDEIAPLKITGVVAVDPLRARLHALVDSICLSDERLQFLEVVLERMVRIDRDAAKPVDDLLDVSNHRK